MKDEGGVVSRVVLLDVRGWLLEPVRGLMNRANGLAIVGLPNTVFVVSDLRAFWPVGQGPIFRVRMQGPCDRLSIVPYMERG